MRIRSEGAIPRLDLAVLLRFVPALWAEWGSLRFASDGRLVDPDTGESLDVLRLSEGRHRTAGARYTISAEPPAGDSPRYTFTLADDDGRTVRGTLSGPPGTARIAIGHQPSAAGQGTVAAGKPYSLAGPLSGGEWTADVRIGDRWSPEGRAGVAAPDWSLGLTFGARWHATARVDVRKLLLANDVPNYAITLIGGREATVDLEIDPSVIDRHGELVSGRVGVQRVAADGVVDVQAKSDTWHCRVRLHLHGRGLIGRSALLAARPAVRRAAQAGFTEFWTDLAAQATAVKNTLADIARDTAAPGAAQERLHRELWEGLRQLARENRATSAASPVEGDKPGVAVPAGRSRRRRQLVAIAAIIAFLAAVFATVIVLVTGSSGHSSTERDLTSAPSLPVRAATVAAFAGTDLQTGIATSAITGDIRTVPEIATDDLTGRDTGTVWNTAAKATAPGGAVYDVFLLAVDLKPDPHHPSATPTFADSQALGSAAGLAAGWHTTTELGPLNGPPWYPSATTLTGHTLLIIRLDVVPGAAAELRRLTVQLSGPVRQRFLAATRP